MSSGTLHEMPTILQAQPLEAASPSPTAQFDFASPKPRSSAARRCRSTRPLTTWTPALPMTAPLRPPNSLPPSSFLSIPTSPLTRLLPRRSPRPGSPSAPRKGVQFARDDSNPDIPTTHSRQSSWDTRDALGKIRGSSFVTRLKELAVPQTTRAHGAPNDPGSSSNSPTVLRQGIRSSRTADEGSDADADAEERLMEAAPAPAWKGEAEKEEKDEAAKMESFSTPTTPRLQASDLEDPNGNSRLHFLRRGTRTDDEHGGLSEGEGRERLSRALGPGGPFPGLLPVDLVMATMARAHRVVG